MSARSNWSKLRESIIREGALYDTQACEYGKPEEPPRRQDPDTIGNRARGRADMCLDILLYMEMIENGQQVP